MNQLDHSPHGFSQGNRTTSILHRKKSPDGVTFLPFFRNGGGENPARKIP